MHWTAPPSRSTGAGSPGAGWEAWMESVSTHTARAARKTKPRDDGGNMEQDWQLPSLNICKEELGTLFNLLFTVNQLQRFTFAQRVADVRGRQLCLSILAATCQNGDFCGRGRIGRVYKMYRCINVQMYKMYICLYSCHTATPICSQRPERDPSPPSIPFAVQKQEPAWS